MKLLALSLLLISSYALACATDNSSGFLPRNNLQIPAFQKIVTGLTQEQYNAVIKKVEDVYSPIFREQGKTLFIDSDWTDSTVNAFADIFDGKARVRLYGGLARHPVMTVDGLALTICHEIGHHLGGVPKIKNSELYKWASVEGQADYFATLKCLRRVFEKDENTVPGEVPEILKTECEKNHTAEDARICVRSGLAGLAIGALFSELQKTPAGSLSTPDKTEVLETNPDHPRAQCRLDTFFQGAICDRPVSENVSDTDETLGTCHKKNGSATGLRPACWFKADSEN
jgi:hypothetical protein